MGCQLHWTRLSRGASNTPLYWLFCCEMYYSCNQVFFATTWMIIWTNEKMNKRIYSNIYFIWFFYCCNSMVRMSTSWIIFMSYPKISSFMLFSGTSFPYKLTLKHLKCIGSYVFLAILADRGVYKREHNFYDADHMSCLKQIVAIAEWFVLRWY